MTGSNGDVVVCIACDADPDPGPAFRKLPAGLDPDPMWDGIHRGIGLLRAELSASKAAENERPIPLTWLLRADRMTATVFDDPAWCYTRYEAVWHSEQRHGSEIGWHPHLCRWDAASARWAPDLPETDEQLELLTGCLERLRSHVPIHAVRTGFDFHSNRLMEFLERNGVGVDASALPGSVQSGDWWHDWSRTPRAPFVPSRDDYRVPDEVGSQRGIVELPVLVRDLDPLRRTARYLERVLHRRPGGWPAAGRQGVFATARQAVFSAAAGQTLQLQRSRRTAFVTAYFHACELSSSDARRRLIDNLIWLQATTRQMGRRFVPETLSSAARRVV